MNWHVLSNVPFLEDFFVVSAYVLVHSTSDVFILYVPVVEGFVTTFQGRLGSFLQVWVCPKVPRMIPLSSL